MNDSDKTILDIDLDDLFKDDIEDSQSSDGDGEGAGENKDLTKNMSQRINTVRAKTEKETQDKVAKELGYESYEAMKKAQTDKLITEHGYDPTDLEKVIAPIVEKRFESDPRFKELEVIKQRDRKIYVEEQLKAINESTGQELKVSDLSKDKEVLDLWGRGIELEQAYYAIHGKSVVSTIASKIQSGTMTHLTPGSSNSGTKRRVLTDEEKGIWKALHPDITDEELSKKTTEIK